MCQCAKHQPYLQLMHDLEEDARWQTDDAFRARLEAAAEWMKKELPNVCSCSMSKGEGNV